MLVIKLVDLFDYVWRLRDIIGLSWGTHGLLLLVLLLHLIIRELLLSICWLSNISLSSLGWLLDVLGNLLIGNWSYRILNNGSLQEIRVIIH